MAALIPSASATGSGTMTLAGPSTNSNQTVTIPDATGTMMVSGNMPAFGATLSTSQTFTANTWTKVQFNSEDFDTNTCYDPSTNYRFTPNVAGYYQINTWISFDSSATNPTSVGAKIYKNGSYYRIGNFQAATSNSSVMVGGSGIVYANGSTDYFETYGYMNGGSGTISVYPTGSYFSAALVRSA
jgi:hypothetical protein